MPTTPGRGLATLGLALAVGCGSEPDRPNVVLISVDMLRPDHLACYGYARRTSPNIDRLAAEGALYENHIASSSWTLPSHAAIFTSLPDSLHGCTDTDRALDPSATTLAERFAAAGYATAGFFAGPYLHPAFGLGQGFATYEDCASYAERIDGRPPSEWAMDPEVMHASHEDVTNERVHAAISRWMSQRSGEPFFLFVHLWDVHFDFVPPPPYDTLFGERYEGWVDGRNFFFDPRYGPGMDARDRERLLALYDGEIAWTDSIVGRIRQDLEAAGLLDDTVLALTSDHGTEFFEHGAKGHRRTLFDEVIRTPLVVRYPPKLSAGRRVSAQTRGIDVGPTLLELAGLPAPNDVYGRSLVPLAETPGAPGVGRAVSELASVGVNLRAVRTPDWKLFDWIGTPEHVYFDLARDPGELVPRLDFESELGGRAVAGYEAEIEGLNAFAARHRVPAASGAPFSDPPPEVLDRLRQQGYVGGSASDPK